MLVSSEVTLAPLKNTEWQRSQDGLCLCHGQARSTSCGPRRASERLADFPSRKERLKNLWIDTKPKRRESGAKALGDSYSCRWPCSGDSCVCNGKFESTHRGKNNEIYEWSTQQDGAGVLCHRFLALRNPSKPPDFPPRPLFDDELVPPPGYLPPPLDVEILWQEWRKREQQILEREAEV